MGKGRHQTHKETIPPLIGRALHLRLQPAPRVTWVGAGWAALCGIVAAGTLQLNTDVAIRVLLALVLADPILGAVWTTLYALGDRSLDDVSEPNHQPVDPVADGRVSLAPRVIRAFRPEDAGGVEAEVSIEDLGLQPLQTSFWASIAAGLDGNLSRRLFETPLAGLRTSLGSARTWWTGQTSADRQPALNLALLFGLALLLGLILGQTVAIAVALGLVFPLVVWFALGGGPLRAGWTRAVLEIGLPWAIGLAAFAEAPAAQLDGLAGLSLSTIDWAGGHATALVVGLLFVVAYYGKLTLGQPLRAIERRALVTLPQVVAVVLLVAWRQPILAGAAAMLVLAQILFQPYLIHRQVRWYLRSTQWMFMGVMLTTALGVAGYGI